MSFTSLIHGTSLGSLGRDVAEPVAKRMAGSALGEALAQRLYPRARPRPIQYVDGGADFTLPQGAYLEAKMATVGRHLDMRALQVEHMRKRGSRFVVALYNRQTADAAGERAVSVDDWVLVLGRSLVAVIDTSGDWVASWFSEHGRGGPTILSVPTAKFVEAVAKHANTGKLFVNVAWDVGEPRVVRTVLPVFFVGKPSQYFDARNTRAQRDSRMKRGAYAPREEAF